MDYKELLKDRDFSSPDEVCEWMDNAQKAITELSGKIGELEKQLADIKNILGNEYDLDRLKVIMNQRVSLKEEVAERWKLTGDIPLDCLAGLVKLYKVIDKNYQFRELMEMISVDRLAEIVRAEKDGRLLTLDLNMLLSIGAGLHAIINNKKIHCAYYYTDLKKQFGGPYSIHFLDAVAILSDIFYPKQEMLKALKEGENNG